jgi:hypothetical protein
MTLISEMAQLMEDEFTVLNAEGINPIPQVTTEYQVFSYTDPDPDRREPGVESPTPIATTDLTCINLVIDEIKRWDKEEKELNVVGQAEIEVTQAVWTKESLQGLDLPDGQRGYFVLDGVRYTPINGGIKDVDGLTFAVVLKRI